MPQLTRQVQPNVLSPGGTYTFLRTGVAWANNFSAEHVARAFTLPESQALPTAADQWRGL